MSHTETTKTPMRLEMSAFSPRFESKRKTEPINHFDKRSMSSFDPDVLVIDTKIKGANGEFSYEEILLSTPTLIELEKNLISDQPIVALEDEETKNINLMGIFKKDRILMCLNLRNLKLKKNCL